MGLTEEQTTELFLYFAGVGLAVLLIVGLVTPLPSRRFQAGRAALPT